MECHVIRCPIAMRAVELAAIVAAAAALAGAPHAQETVPKQVHLVIDGNRLIASNVKFSRFDDLKLDARERVRDSAVGEAVILVATNQRIIGYGVVSGWRPIDRLANEEIKSLSAEDYAGLVVTTQRLLNFNGESGVWGEHTLGVSR